MPLGFMQMLLSKIAAKQCIIAESEACQKSRRWTFGEMKDTNKLVQGYIASIPFDRRLYYQDIEGSIVYARMLPKRRILENSALQALFRMLMSSRYRPFWWSYVE